MHTADILLTLPLKEPSSIFFAVLAILLVVPLIFNRLRIPYIIGLIAAGIAVGPYGFNILARDASFEIFGEVGILYLMFLAGGEIDMYNLKRNYHSGIIFGLLTFALPLGAGLLCMVLLPDISVMSMAIIAVMFASHTLLTYPIVQRFGLTTSRGAVIAVCGTIVAVLLALMVLAAIVQAVSDAAIADAIPTFSFSSSAWLILKCIVYVCALGWLTPIVTRFFLRKFNDGITQFVYILAMVLLFAEVARLIGVASILGAFYAGLVLNRFIPSRSTLMSRLEFVGNAIFIPYFLIGVGMLINIRLLVQGWDVLYTAGVMTLLALVSKWISALAIQKILRLGKLQRRMIFGLTSGKAAATIAATLIGYQYGLLSETVMNGAVLMILGCCIVSSIVTQSTAIRLRMQLTAEDLQDSRSSSGARRESRQMIAVANPITSEGLMKLAALIRTPNDTNKAVLLFVSNSDDPMQRAMGRNSLQVAAKAAAIIGLSTREVMRYDLNLVAGITNAMKEHDSEELIMGLHRPSTSFDSFLGSMEEKLVQQTNRMVIFSRCFVPINTLRRLMVVVPPKAEYETGFAQWVASISNLSVQLGMPVEYMASPHTFPYLKEKIAATSAEYEYTLQPKENWDDFIILSSRVGDDDLLVIIGARRHSISYGAEVEAIPAYLNKYFRRYNMLVIYPEQFGNTAVITAPLDPLAHTL